MTRIIVLGMLSLIYTGCGKSSVPEGVLTEKQMVNVMTELYLAEERVGRLPISQDSGKQIFPAFSAKAFEIAEISDSIFLKSLDYYMSEPEKLENIYTILVDSLNLKAQRASAHKKDVAPE